MTHHEYIVGDGVHEVVFGNIKGGWMIPGTHSHVLHEKFADKLMSSY
jgi:hypothetical protein